MITDVTIILGVLLSLSAVFAIIDQVVTHVV